MIRFLIPVLLAIQMLFIHTLSAQNIPESLMKAEASFFEIIEKSYSHIPLTPDSISQLEKFFFKNSLSTHLNGFNSRLDLYLLKSFLLYNHLEEAKNVFRGIPFGDLEYTYFEVFYWLSKGDILLQDKKYTEALNAFYAALHLSKERDYYKLISHINYRIGKVLSSNSDIENSIRFFSMALEDAKKNNVIEVEVSIYMELCKIYNDEISLNLDSAIHYGNLGIELSRKSEYFFGYIQMLLTSSSSFIKNNELEKGFAMSKEAMEYADRFNFTNSQRYFLVLDQGFVFVKEGVYNSADEKVRLAKELMPMGDTHLKLEYLIYKSKGNLEKSLEKLEQYANKRQLKDRQKIVEKLSALQARQEAYFRKQTLRELRQQNENQTFKIKQQRYLIIGIVILITIVIISLILYYKQRFLKQKNRSIDKELNEVNLKLTLQKRYRSAELKAIRSQLNPHFIFNALNSIQEYIMVNERKKAGKYLGKFADLIRIYLNHSQVKEVKLQDEVAAISLYLELEKIRFEDTMDCFLELDSKLDLEDVKIPSMLIQPFVENAIRHGLLHKYKDRKLWIRFSVDTLDEMVVCEIEDNGIGRKKSAEINKNRSDFHQSFSTGAIDERLKLMNFGRTNKVILSMIDLADKEGNSLGTKVILNIPFMGVN